MSEQGVGGAVELRGGDDIATQLGYILDGISHRCLAAGNAHCVAASFEGRDPSLQHSSSWVTNPGISIAVHFQVEERRCVFGAIECISDRLVDRHRDSFGCGINVITAVDCNRFPFHAFTRPWPFPAYCCSSLIPASRFISLTTQ